jgi:hypothetical protein
MKEIVLVFLLLNAKTFWLPLVWQREEASPLVALDDTADRTTPATNKTKKVPGKTRQATVLAASSGRKQNCCTMMVVAGR